MERVYHPLLNDEIRVLTLKPGTNGESLSCKLSTKSLASRPKYEALSYVWGGKTPVEEISVDEEKCSARRNPAAALRALRHKTEDRFLWVDAICINQKDLDEREMQVGLMKEIYDGTSELLVWLGPESPADKAMKQSDLQLTLGRNFRSKHLRTTLLYPSPE
jgi:Heterokaryon incompatibility protein (HET)